MAEDLKNPDMVPAPVRGYGWEWCDECHRWLPKGSPPHQASPNCQSGGRNHCTCDPCF